MSHTIALLAGRRKKIYAALGLLLLVAAWWAFRPEKLFINQRVNEAAPFVAGDDPQPVLTGPLEDTAHRTVGRATIYKTAAGRHYLRISGVSASAATLNVMLQGAGREIHLGTLQSPGAQNFDLAPAVDLNQYDTVAISSSQSGAFAVAKLQAF